MDYSGFISGLIIAFCICTDFRAFAVLESSQSAPTQKKQLKFEAGLPREKLQHFNDVPEEVHQKWEQFKQTHCTYLLLLMCKNVQYMYTRYVHYSVLVNHENFVFRFETERVLSILRLKPSGI